MEDGVIREKEGKKEDKKQGQITSTEEGNRKDVKEKEI